MKTIIWLVILTIAGSFLAYALVTPQHIDTITISTPAAGEVLVPGQDYSSTIKVLGYIPTTFKEKVEHYLLVVEHYVTSLILPSTAEYTVFLKDATRTGAPEVKLGVMSIHKSSFAWTVPSDAHGSYQLHLAADTDVRASEREEFSSIFVVR